MNSSSDIHAQNINKNILAIFYPFVYPPPQVYAMALSVILTIDPPRPYYKLVKYFIIIDVCHISSKT